VESRKQLAVSGQFENRVFRGALNDPLWFKRKNEVVQKGYQAWLTINSTALTVGFYA
jgi:hypothetical protein